MRMAGGMAHDFNNYLTAIQGNNELVLSQLQEDAPYARSVRQICTLSQSALNLSHRIQIFAGQALTEPVPCDPVNFLHLHYEALQNVVFNGQRLQLQLPDACPMIMVDPALLALAIQSLVTNASEALTDTEGDITISVGELGPDSEGNVPNFHDVKLSAAKYAYFEVRDTGNGMDAETMANAFDPFFTTKIRAEGMGLPLVLGIAWAHHGGVQLDSHPGDGTSVRLLLPL